MHLYPIDGAVHDVASDETAFACRDATWSSVFAGVDPDPANFLMEEGQDRIRATYGANYDRLAEVKARYDPENPFRRKQNIPPAAAA